MRKKLQGAVAAERVELGIGRLAGPTSLETHSLASQGTHIATASASFASGLQLRRASRVLPLVELTGQTRQAGGWTGSFPAVHDNLLFETSPRRSGMRRQQAPSTRPPSISSNGGVELGPNRGLDLQGDAASNAPDGAATSGMAAAHGLPQPLPQETAAKQLGVEAAQRHAPQPLLRSGTVAGAVALQHTDPGAGSSAHPATTPEIEPINTSDDPLPVTRPPLTAVQSAAAAAAYDKAFASYMWWIPLVCWVLVVPTGILNLASFINVLYIGPADPDDIVTYLLMRIPFHSLAWRSETINITTAWCIYVAVVMKLWWETGKLVEQALITSHWAAWRHGCWGSFPKKKWHLRILVWVIHISAVTTATAITILQFYDTSLPSKIGTASGGALTLLLLALFEWLKEIKVTVPPTQNVVELSTYPAAPGSSPAAPNTSPAATSPPHLPPTTAPTPPAHFPNATSTLPNAPSDATSSSSIQQQQQAAAGPASRGSSPTANDVPPDSAPASSTAASSVTPPVDHLGGPLPPWWPGDDALVEWTASGWVATTHSPLVVPLMLEAFRLPHGYILPTEPEWIALRDEFRSAFEGTPRPAVHHTVHGVYMHRNVQDALLLSAPLKLLELFEHWAGRHVHATIERMRGQPGPSGGLNGDVPGTSAAELASLPSRQGSSRQGRAPATIPPVG